jgi:hypothetical protein
MARPGIFRREYNRFRRLQELITEVESEAELITFNEAIGSELAVRGRERIRMFDEHTTKKGGSHES